jgi:hypothetical protein
MIAVPRERFPGTDGTAHPAAREFLAATVIAVVPDRSPEELS